MAPEAIRFTRRGFLASTVSAAALTALGVADSGTAHAAGIPIYLDGSNSTDNDLRSFTGGCEVTYPGSGTYLIRYWQYFEHLQQISLTLNVLVNAGATMKVGFSDVRGNVFAYTLTAAQLAVGQRTIVLNLGNFTGTYAGPHSKGDEITWFRIEISGNVNFAIQVSNVVATTSSTPVVTRALFDPSFMPLGFPTRLYPTPPASKNWPRQPRAFVADATGSALATTPRLKDLALDWPAFGLDVNVVHVGANRQLVTELGLAGIRTIFENTAIGHLQNSPYLSYKGAFLTRSDGKRCDEDWDQPGAPGFFPMHGADFTRVETYNVTKALIEQSAAEGFTDHLLVDYVWPWNGQYGYAPETIAAFRADLAETDPGLYLSIGGATYAHYRFWDYVAVYADVTITPADLGIASWANFSPVTLQAASTGTVQQKRNYFLYNALYHYEYLKFLQRVGDVARNNGIGVLPEPNPEDVANGSDPVLMTRCRGVSKLGLEFFGSARATSAYYHFMPRLSAQATYHGTDLALIGEINAGGHGATRYIWDAAYAFYYDITSAAKPVEYNNQYLEGGPWPRIDNVTLKDGYHFGRYAHWSAGALAFFHSHAERATPPAQKSAVLVCTRGPLWGHPGSQYSMAQAGNIGDLVEQLHHPFDMVGKERMAASLPATQRCIYVPAETSPQDAATLSNWINAGSGRSVLTHSWVPFTAMRPQIQQPRGTDPDQVFGLTLVGVTAAKLLTVSYGGVTAAGTRQVYNISGPTAQVVLAASDGTTLVSKMAHGANFIVYIHVDVSAIPSITDGAYVRDPFDRAIVHAALVASGSRAELTGPDTVSAHLYEVPGGGASVLWHRPTLSTQTTANRYERIPLTTPIPLALTASPGTQYTVHNFYDGTTTTKTSDASGSLTITQSRSVEIFYWGKANDSTFAAHLNAVRATRAKLAKYEPDTIPASQVFSAAVNGASTADRFLSFTAGLDDANVNLSDGTTVNFYVPGTGDREWEPVGSFNTNGRNIGSSVRHGIRLGATNPAQILAVVTCNTVSSHDITYIDSLVVADRDGNTVRTFGSIADRGLISVLFRDNDTTQFTNSGAQASGTAARWSLKPAWSNSIAPVYAVLTA